MQGNAPIRRASGGRDRSRRKGTLTFHFVRFRNAITGGTRMFRTVGGQMTGAAVSPATLELTLAVIP
jgi:hypothetical protein